MRKSIYQLLIAGVLIAATGSLQAQTTARERRDREREQVRDREQMRADAAMLDQRTKELNSTTRGDRYDYALKTVSIETGVPEDRVRKLARAHPNRVADILNACVLADSTKKDPEDHYRERADGKSWAELANQYRVPVEKLTERLDHLDRAMGRASSTRNRR